MTGAEITPLSAAAKGTTAIGKFLVGDSAEKETILESAKASPGYRAAGVAKGDRMAAKQLAINRALSPLFWFAGYKRTYFEGEQFPQDLADRLTDVSEDDLVTPSPIVAAQAMAGLSYSLDEPDLKEMYLNLLAAAIHPGRSKSAHPSFAEIIRQLSSDEAKILGKYIRDRTSLPVAEIRCINDEGGFIPRWRHFADHGNSEVDIDFVTHWFPLYVDNWIRLGLIDVSYDRRQTSEDAYDYVESSPEYRLLVEGWKQGDFLKPSFQKGVLARTEFGLKFAYVVLPGWPHGGHP